MKFRNLILVAVVAVSLASCSSENNNESKDGLISIEAQHGNGMIKNQYKVKLNEKGNYRIEGDYSEWHPNGTLKTKGIYLNNQKEGMWNIWNKDGVLIQEIEYKKGKKDGNFVSYYPNKKMKERGQFIKNRKEGEWTLFFIDGKKKVKGMMKENKRIGKWQRWDKEGKEIEAIDYNKLPKKKAGAKKKEDHKKKI